MISMTYYQGNCTHYFRILLLFGYKISFVFDNSLNIINNMRKYTNNFVIPN